MEVKKILLIDDEDDIRKIAGMSLGKIGGFEIIAESSAADGITRAENERPDLIIMDMMMPEMDGLTAFEKLKTMEELSKIPVIFMTAKVQKTEKDTYLEKGAAGVIAKPFDPMTLSQDVKKIIETL